MSRQAGPSEHDIQATFIDWCRLHEKDDPRLGLIFAIPNGGKRSYGTAKKLAREGVKPGVFDLFLPVRNGDEHGLWIEMKSARGELSEAQRGWMRAMIGQRYGCVVCHTVDEAIETICEYLELELASE